MPASDFANPADSFLVRPAQPSDAKPFRMILPDVRGAAVRLVAVSVSDERVVAAAALTKSMRAKPPVGPGVGLHVIPTWRRRGIGNSLMKSLQAVALERQAGALYSMQKVKSGTDEEQGWRWLGFEPMETVIYHELPLRGIETRLAPLYGAMREQGWIPGGAEIVALCDSDREAVAELHLKVLGGHRATLLDKLRCAGRGTYHPVSSRVLLVDGEVKGCILAHRESKEVAVVDANILDPSVRGGWANLWLKLEATRGAVQLGIERFVYSTFDHYSDTRAFSAMLGGVETRRMLLMHCPLDGPDGGDAE